MNHRIHLVSFVVAGLLVAVGASAQQRADLQIDPDAGPAPAAVRWLPAGPDDFGADTLVAEPAALPASRHAESAPVSFAFPLSGVSDSLAPVRARVESRQYFVDTDGAELARGIALPISAPGAVVRISPLESGGDLTIEPGRVTLAINNRKLDAARAMRRIADGAALNRQGMAVPVESLAFKLDDQVPAGELTLSAAGLPSKRAMVVHVFEPESPYVAELELPRHNFVAGEKLEFDFALTGSPDSGRMSSVKAVLADPYAAESWALEVDTAASKLTGQAPGGRFVSGFDGLFEAHVYLEAVRDGIVVRRDLKLPLAVVPAVARLTGGVDVSRADGLVLSVGIETAAAGRFQLNGQVFGTGPDGTLKPLAMAQSAAVLAAGAGRIELAVPADLLAGSGLSAPFEVRNLELVDQGRMFVLERRTRGLSVR